MNQSKPYLYCHSGSGYYYTRLTVPVDLRYYYNKTCLKRSLRTKNLQLASTIAAQVIYQYKREFDILRFMGRKPRKPPTIGLISVELPDGSKTTIEQSSPEEELRQAKQILETVSPRLDPTSPSSPSPRPTPITEVVDQYCKERLQIGAWSPQTRLENQAAYTLFLKIVGEDITTDQLDFTIARKYKEVILQLPPNMSKTRELRGLSIQQIIEKRLEPMSTRTMNKYLSGISSLMDWAIRHGYVETNYFNKLTIKKSSNASEERLPFDQKDLDNLLDYPKKPLHDYYHWLPLLAYYTGARLEELCSLYLDDIYQDDGIWVIDINRNTKDKHIKTGSSIRKVPFHDSLIEMDFLSFINKQRLKGHERLFPELKYQNLKYGKAASKWFKRYRDKNGVYDKRKAFHSFRHTFTERLKIAGVEPHFIAALLGHKDETMTTGRYGSGKWPLVDLHKANNSLQM